MKRDQHQTRWDQRELRRAARVELGHVEQLNSMKMAQDMACVLDAEIERDIGSMNCANTLSAAPVLSLDARKLTAMLENLNREFPALPSHKFDIYGSDLVPTLIEIRPKGIAEILPDFPKDRRVLICPKVQLHSIARELAEAGADVRIEPRVREPVDLDAIQALCDGSEPQ